jgi:hypothetical protein
MYQGSGVATSPNVLSIKEVFASKNFGEPEDRTFYAVLYEIAPEDTRRGEIYEDKIYFYFPVDV